MGMRSRLPGRALAADAVLAVLLAPVVVYGSERAAAYQTASRRPLDSLALALFVAATLALAGRRVAPLPVLAVTAASGVVCLVLRYPYGPMFLAPVIAIYTAGRHLPVRLSLPAVLATAVAFILPEVPGLAGGQLAASLISLVAWHGWLLLPWLVGAGMRVHGDSIRRDREEEARRLAYEERLRVAQDVHDVVGHGLAVINMQAAVALHVAERRPEQARVALEAIKQTSKDALDELRATLAVFRSEAGDARRPPPGLGEVPAVVAAMADSGLEVDLVVTGQPVALPAAVDLAAYRIVQESLTNVVRHAGQAAATVRIGYEPRAVTVEVTDDGRARPNGGGNGQARGNGIAGMRERAAATGGTVEAGPRPEGGFRVVARLPTGARA